MNRAFVLLCFIVQLVIISCKIAPQEPTDNHASLLTSSSEETDENVSPANTDENMSRMVLGDPEVIGAHVGIPLGDREHTIKRLLDSVGNHNYTEETLSLLETVKEPKRKRLSKFKCLSCSPPDCHDLRVCTGAIKCWVSHTQLFSGEEHYSRGCADSVANVNFYCNIERFRQDHPDAPGYAFSCCDGNLCNNKSFPPLPPLQSYNEVNNYGPGADYFLKLFLSIVCPVLVLVLLVGGLLIVMRAWHRRRMEALTLPEIHPFLPENFFMGNQVDASLRDLSFASGSGSGLPLLIQRSLAKQISLRECVGKGRYGNVWRGIWQGDSVAVKVFFSRDESSWSRETEIYSTILLRHENIVGFIGSDVTSHNNCTQLWLITHYHPLGSLYDHLNRQTLTYSQTMKICSSLLAGVVHLHTEIFGKQGKPAIAHRDIKSKNILVKLDGMCCIADFGLAVTHSERTGEINHPDNTRVGTKRYMAPELLDFSLNVNSFESFRQVDVYALGLVLWEVTRRCLSMGKAEEYQPPYYDVVNTDPGFDDMKQVVCVQKYRPQLPEYWATDPVLEGMGSLMTQCWAENPQVRLKALRIKKNLHKLSLQCPKIGKELDL